MKLSDISNIEVVPGIYVITAVFDGNDIYKAKKTWWQLTVGKKPAPAPHRARAIEDPDYEAPDKRDPDIKFTTAVVTINETDAGQLSLDWTQYLVNNDNVSYNVTYSDGLIILDSSTVSWAESGTYNITITTVESELFNSVDKTLKLNITVAEDPMIEYSNSNNQFIIEDGNLIKEYYNLEGRDGVYQFDLMLPNNPYGLPIEYSIDINYGNSVVDIDENTGEYKFHLTEEGDYKVTAEFKGDSTFRPAVTSYIARFKQKAYVPPSEYPIIEFANDNVRVFRNDDNTYDLQVPSFVYPSNLEYHYSIEYIHDGSGAKYQTSHAQIIDNETKVQIDYDFYGYIIIKATSAEYNHGIAGADYKLTIRYADQQTPHMYFERNPDTYEQNNQNAYPRQEIKNKPDGVKIEWTYSDGAEYSGNRIRYNGTGDILVTATSQENAYYTSQTISYTLRITEAQTQEKESPNIYFDKESDSFTKTPQGIYTLPTLHNDNNVPVTWSASNGEISNGTLVWDGTGSSVITVVSTETAQYVSQTVTYTIYVSDQSKVSPNISFGQIVVRIPQNENGVYSIQTLNNINGVPVSWSSDKGLLSPANNPTSIIYSGNGDIGITVVSAETDLYTSQTVYYTLRIEAHSQTSPSLSFSQSTVPVDHNSQGQYDLQTINPLNNPHTVSPIEWKASSGTITNGVLTFTGTGNITITASFAGDWDYTADSASYTLFIRQATERISPNLSLYSHDNIDNYYYKVYKFADGNHNFQINSPQVRNPYNVSPITFTSSNPDIAYLRQNSSGNVGVVVVNENLDFNYSFTYNLTFTISFAGDDNYLPQTIETPFTVQYIDETHPQERISPNLSWPYDTAKCYIKNGVIYGAGNLFNLSNPYNVSPITYSSSNTNVIKIVNNSIYPAADNISSGSTIITATFAGDDNYLPQSVQFELIATEFEATLARRSTMSYSDETVSGYYKFSDGSYSLPYVYNPSNHPVEITCDIGYIKYGAITDGNGIQSVSVSNPLKINQKDSYGKYSISNIKNYPGYIIQAHIFIRDLYTESFASRYVKFDIIC